MLASPPAVVQLGRLESQSQGTRRPKNRSNGLSSAPRRTPVWIKDDLVELGVPSFELPEVGFLRREFGASQAVIQIEANRKAIWQWTNEKGKQQKSVPTAVKNAFPEELKSLKKTVKEIDKLMPSLRHRVECLFQRQRTWCMTEFRKRFLDHPLVGVIARKLIWNVVTDGYNDTGHLA